MLWNKVNSRRQILSHKFKLFLLSGEMVSSNLANGALLITRLSLKLAQDIGGTNET